MYMEDIKIFVNKNEQETFIQTIKINQNIGMEF